MIIPTWLKVLHYISHVEKVDNIILIAHELKMSPVSVYSACYFLEELGVINIHVEKSHKSVTPTQKLFKTKSVFNDLYETIKRLR